MPFQKKSGQWIGRIQKNGTVRQKAFKLKKEALAWEAEQRALDWSEPIPDIRTVSVLEWADGYLEHAQERFTDKTFVEKRDAFRRVLHFGGKNRLTGISVNDFSIALAAKVLRKRAKDQSGYAANKDRKNLAAAWTWGTRHLGMPRDNPFLGVERFPEEETPRYVPPLEDFWKVLAVVDTDQDRVMLLLMLATGARRGEVLRLLWNDIDFQGGVIRFSTRKTRHGSLEYGTVPLVDEVKDALSANFTAEARGVNVFTRASGKPYTVRQHLMPYLCEKAGVKRFGFHAIRHLTAVWMYRTGQPIHVIQRVLRHKSPLTTTRYLRSLGLNVEEMRDALESMARVIGLAGAVSQQPQEKAPGATTPEAFEEGANYKPLLTTASSS